jgi:hypothetical protein
MTYKWYLLDWRNPQRVVVGNLTNVHRSSFPSDGDTNLEITPDPSDPDSMALLGGGGQTVLECEINVKGDQQDHYENWVRTVINGTTDGKISAEGVWVEDLGHNSKTELHPMDVIFGSVPASTLPGDWIGDLACQHGLVVGDSLIGYRFAVASDDRAGEFQSAPPLAPYTRPVTFNLPFPQRPAQGLWTATTAQRIDRQDNATIEVGDAFVDAAGKTLLPITVTCTAAYDDPAPGADDQVPGVLTGEIVTYWVSATIPQIVLNPTQLSFGKVRILDSRRLSVQIFSTGPVDLVVSASPSPPGPFAWDGLAATTIAPGGSLSLTVDLNPGGIGSTQATLFIQSNAPGSPHAIALHGEGIKGSPF